jgi:hypothetical protein
MSHKDDYRKVLKKMLTENYREGYGTTYMPVEEPSSFMSTEPPQSSHEDQMQNEMLTIKHHVEDALEACQSGQKEMVAGSLQDVLDSIERMKEFLPPEMASELDRMSHENEENEENEEPMTEDMMCSMPDFPGPEKDIQIGSVDPLKPIMTAGETAPMGVERQDEYNVRDDTMSEIASLLVTMGHVLQKDRIVPDKFDIPKILEYLMHNFQENSMSMQGSMYEERSLKKSFHKLLKEQKDLDPKYREILEKNFWELF